jgi:hypothetical protein
VLLLPLLYNFGNVVLQVILLIYSFYDGVLKHPEESGVLFTGLSSHYSICRCPGPVHTSVSMFDSFLASGLALIPASGLFKTRLILLRHGRPKRALNVIRPILGLVQI